MSSVDQNCLTGMVSLLCWMARWPCDLLQAQLKIWTQPLKIALPKWEFFIASTSVALWLHRTWTMTCAFRGTLKSFPYIWGYWRRNIHKYKCLFYQTNAYQTSVIVCSSHNKESWLAHFILWTLSPTAEIKNIFTAAIHVAVCKPLPAAVKISWQNTSVKVGFYEEPHFKWLHELVNEEKLW